MNDFRILPAKGFDYINIGNPPVDVNPPTVPVTWCNMTSGVLFICINNTPGANVWIEVAGGTSYAASLTVNTATTLTIGRHHVISDLASPADYTVTLPPAAGCAGRQLSIAIAPTTTKLITVDGNASELIDGAASRVMWAGETATLLSDGVGWVKVAGKSIPMSFAAHSNASQTGVTSGVETTINLNAEIFDVGGVFDPSTYKATIRRAAKWSLFGTVRMAPSSGTALTATEGSIKIDGGASVVMGNASAVSGASNGVWTSVANGVVSLAAGNALLLRGYATGGGTITFVGHSTNTALATMRGVEICEW